MHINKGRELTAPKMRTRYTVLAYDAGTGVWTEVCERMAQKESVDKVVFSDFARGNRGIRLTTPARVITLDNYLRIEDRHYMLTSINMDDTLYYVLTAAEVNPQALALLRATTVTDATYNRPSNTLVETAFRGVISEKYINASQMDAYVEIETGLILTTPKAVILQPGDIIAASSDRYLVLKCYLQADHRNDYEIVRKDDA